jgi:hypothetical protein
MQPAQGELLSSGNSCIEVRTATAAGNDAMASNIGAHEGATRVTGRGTQGAARINIKTIINNVVRLTGRKKWFKTQNCPFIIVVAAFDL